MKSITPNKLCALFLVVIACAATLALVRGIFKSSPVCRGEDSMASSATADVPSMVKRYVPPLEGEMREYERIVCEIVSAYSNQQANLILECVKKLPDRFFELRGNDWNQAILPMNRAWFDGWSIGEPTMTFKTCEDLRTWLLANLTFAKVYGTMLSKSGNMDMLPAFDVWVLTGLQAHKEKYAKACKRDYLDVTERFIAAWVEQIESERGFTREYMRWQNKSLCRLVKEGELTPAKLRQNIRGNVWPLQKRCGYTPKWLDEEFPLLPEGEKDAWEK